MYIWGDKNLKIDNSAGGLAQMIECLPHRNVNKIILDPPHQLNVPT
jgi:hypothetical protein